MHFLSQAFSSLAEAAYEAAEVADDASEPETYCLSAYFEPIVTKLLDTTDRCVQNMQSCIRGRKSLLSLPAVCVNSSA